MKAIIAVVKIDGLSQKDYMALMPEHRRRRIENARTPGIAAQQAGAEIAFLVAADAVGISPQYTYLADGRPHPSAAGYYMSLTHTEGLAACVIAEVPVGIDAEGKRKILPSLARKILAPDETGDLRETWVKKESYLKRTGEGIRRPMTGFSVKEIDGYLHSFSLDEYFLCVSFAEEMETELLTLDQNKLKNYFE